MRGRKSHLRRRLGISPTTFYKWQGRYKERGPKDNCLVERVIKTSCQEAWDYRWSEDPKELQEICADWVHFYNHIRPHDSLGRMTPMDYYLSRWDDEAAPDTDQVSTM